jgi:hypothetical protein
VHAWDVDALREGEECATDFNVLVEESAPWVPIGKDAVLRAVGLEPGDIVWVSFDSEDPTA